MNVLSCCMCLEDNVVNHTSNKPDYVRYYIQGNGLCEPHAKIFITETIKVSQQKKQLEDEMIRKIMNGEQV